MPEKYMLEMMCDWRAMSRKFGDTAGDYFSKNQHKMVLHPETIQKIEEKLFLHVARTPANNKNAQ